MSQNESTTFLVTDAKNLTLIDATRENSPWCRADLAGPQGWPWGQAGETAVVVNDA